MSDNQNNVRQVIEAARRVAQLRTSVPQALSNRFKGMLESCRPTPQAEAAAAEESGGQEAGAADASISPAPIELQDRLAAVTDGIPALR